MWDSLFDLGEADSLAYGTVQLNVQLFHLENSDGESRAKSLVTKTVTEKAPNRHTNRQKQPI